MNSTNSIDTNGAQKNIDQKKLDEFKAGFRGSVLPAGSHGYEQARKIWNRFVTGFYVYRKQALIFKNL